MIPVEGLAAHVVLRRGDLQVNVELRAARGETVALLGPNGAGKTTVVHALAGLLPMEHGAVSCGGMDFASPAGKPLPPDRRPVAVVFQDYLLFPHLTACDNVAFGLRSRGVDAATARRTALAALTRLDLAAVAGMRPAQLSGGQAQRVALARALVTSPRLLLLDEPLGALDVRARSAARSHLRGLLTGFEGVALVVTHDPVDAMTLADRVMVMEEGRVVQSGTTAEIAARPRSRYVADFVGVNLFRGRVRDGVLEAGGGRLQVATPGEGEVFAVVHPRAVVLHRRPPDGSARNVWAVRVGDIEMTADRGRVQVSGELSLVAEVTRAAVEDLRLMDGGDAWAEVKATAFDVYPA